MDTAEAARLADRYLDLSYLSSTASALARVSTAVTPGFDTLMEPDDPKLVHYVQQVVRPRLADLDVVLTDVPGNNLLATVGRGTSAHSLLLQNYTVTQHHNLMPDPFSGRIGSAREFGFDEPAVFGQGVSQNKVHQAVMLAVLKMLRDAGVELTGRLYWAMNNEGRSSHDCSTSIVAALPAPPEFAILQLGGLRISLGNRGRVDLNVHVRGKATHSSAPQLGHSAIDGSYEVIGRLRTLKWTDDHPLLGGRHAVVYKIRYEPLAPHTIPSDAFMTIDRRMLPGDSPSGARLEVAGVLGGLDPIEVTVEEGTQMLPALVDPHHPGVRALAAAHRVVTGTEAEAYYGLGTFDAGGLCHLGIPAVMYGAKGGVWPTGTDFVLLSDLQTEARVLATVVLSQLS